MRFAFKKLEYQQEAASSIADVFEGQPLASAASFTTGIAPNSSDQVLELSTFLGFANNEIVLSDEELNENIAKIRRRNEVRIADNEASPLGRVSLDVEMETGTGKTYVYMNAIYELNRLYGWTKFIIVTPSIAIREGVKKSIDMTRDHFAGDYNGKKLRAFIYSGSNLTDIQTFASDSGINVMIINTQAFAASFSEDNKRSKVSRIIYSERDNFGSYRPIDIIAATRPILILDEPQKMGGEKSVTQKALRNFNPLFTMNFSATHAIHHRTIYSLDALDAYNRKLVKRIEVKELEAKNLPGSGCYLYLGEILVSRDEEPRARIELEISYDSGIKREYRILSKGADLFEISKGLEQYNGVVISEIDAIEGVVKFTNGDVITVGDLSGDPTALELRRIQIRETINSHLAKEQKLFEKGIKTLSLFFIDEVAKYRYYDESGKPCLGEYGKIFEEEYAQAVKDLEDKGKISSEYRAYLDRFKADEVHNGYFSIDKHGHSIDSAVRRGKDTSDDVSAYDLILKNKERLLSLEQPTKFIFSHSALREGWDNPNIFQICFLKKGGDSRISKRQEIGRGMRIAVNKDGERMDEKACEKLGADVHKINLLTVIAGESYANFAESLQAEIVDALRGRPDKANAVYFVDKTVSTKDGEVTIDKEKAQRIYEALVEHKYVETDGELTEKYYADSEKNDIESVLPDDMKELEGGVKKLLSEVVSKHIVKKLYHRAEKTKVESEPLNDRFKDPRFQELWNAINHKYSYEIIFKSEDLIKAAVKNINRNLQISELRYTVTTSMQKEKMTSEDLHYREGFTKSGTVSDVLNVQAPPRTKYDLIKRLADGTKLTRRSISAILRTIDPEKFALYAKAPEEFIKKTTKLINDVKANVSLDHIVYKERENEKYDDKIFEESVPNVSLDRRIPVKKSIQDHVYVDSRNERVFTEDLENSNNVALYAKLPRGFFVPTPAGNYSPDWAIIFNEKDGMKKIYFIAETKGTMSSMSLREEENIKINCAQHFFEQFHEFDKIGYVLVDSFESLLNCALRRPKADKNEANDAEHSGKASNDAAAIAEEVERIAKMFPDVVKETTVNGKTVRVIDFKALERKLSGAVPKKDS